MYNTFRRSWTDKKTGKVVQAKTFSIRYKLAGDSSWRSKDTKISDKQSAEAYAKNWHIQKEREGQGLAIPEAELKSATASLVPLVESFLATLKIDGCTKDHISNVQAHLKLLLAECGWKRVQDINAASFTAWNVKQGHRAPKTRNEFLGSAKHFCKWLIAQDKLVINPLAKVERSKTRGNETRRRRVLSIAELGQLLAVSGKRVFVYSFAFYTGIRRGELEKLLVSDFQKDKGGWWVRVRASISKNRKETCLPIHHALVPLLEAHLVERAGLRLFFKSVPRCDTLREDLKRAGLEYKDAEGKQADFHALRHGTSTHMGANGAAPRAHMGMMRHGDMKLTMNTYTDETHISYREAIEKVPNVLDLTPVSLTHPLTHGLVVSSPNESLTVATDQSDEETQLPFMQASKRGLTPFVASSRKGRKAAALGLEPSHSQR